MLGAILTGCSAIAERFSEHHALVGCWYGHGEQGTAGNDVYWMLQRGRDGSFVARFHSFSGNQLILEQTELGRWAYSTGLYTVVTTSIVDRDGHASRVSFQDVYQVPDVDGRPLIYIQLNNGRRHESQPVPCDFKLPNAPVTDS